MSDTAFIQLDGASEQLKIAEFRDRPIFVYPGAAGYDGIYYAELAHDLLAHVVRDVGVGVVVVTHNRSLAGRADRVLLLADGVLTDTSGTEGAV